MARYGARTNYLLARHKAKDKQKLERAIKSAEAKAEKNKMWSTIGRTAGVIAGVALAPVTGGASLALAAGAGSYAGSKLGDMAVGGEDTLDYKGRFYKQESRNIQEGLTEANKQEEWARVANAASDAFSVFTLGGGQETFKAGAESVKGGSMWDTFKAGAKAVGEKKVTKGELLQNFASNFGVDKAKEKVANKVISSSSPGVGGYMGSEIEDGFSNMMLQRAQQQLQDKIQGLAPSSPESLFYPKL